MMLAHVSCGVVTRTEKSRDPKSWRRRIRQNSEMCKMIMRGVAD